MDAPPIGQFRAACRLPDETGERCRGEWHVYEDFREHMRTVHPAQYKKHREHMNGRGKADLKPRKQPFGRPAVALDKQQIAPGTVFEAQGVRCQVIGAVSKDRVRYFAWAPEDKPLSPARRKTAVCHGQDGDAVLWELTAPTSVVLKAMGDSSDAQ